MKCSIASTLRSACLAVVVSSAALGAPRCLGQATATVADAPTATVTRTYNVGELVQTAPDYPLQEAPAEQRGGGGGGGAPFGGGALPTGGRAVAVNTSERVEQLQKLIKELIDPAGWRDNGGDVGAMKVLGDALVVTQTAKHHAEIQELLDGIRRDAGLDVTVEVEARWLLLTPQELEAIEGGPDAKGGAGVRLGALKDENAATYCRARTVGFNGQTLSVTSGRTTSVVASATPVVGTGVALYDISTVRERSGVALEVTPRLSRDRKSITVNVRSVVSEGQPSTGAAAVGTLPVRVAPATQPMGLGGLGGAGAAGVADATREAAQAIDRPDRVEQNYQTTVRLTPGVPVIVGGMTMEPGKGGGRQLYLVLLARAVEGDAK